MACRYIDDCADENELPEAKLLISRIKQQLLALTNHEIQNRDRFSILIEELVSHGVDPHNLSELVDGADFDLEQSQIRDLPELLRYCYLVAGVVGLMMCPLLGAKAVRARKYAVDLGIGMQLTNICRDILEDHSNGRIYLPELRLLAHDFQSLRSSAAFKRNVKKYLDLADQYYFNGYRGLAYLPLRSRLAILIAGEVYRHIGEKIRSNDYETLQGRTVLTLFEKIKVAVFSIRHLFKKWFWQPGPHIEVLEFGMVNSLPGNKTMERT